VKALADIIYARNRTWDSINDLSEDLRIEIDILQNYESELLTELIKNYPSPRVKKTLYNFCITKTPKLAELVCYRA
jgi:hypothetical protein